MIHSKNRFGFNVRLITALIFSAAVLSAQTLPPIYDGAKGLRQTQLQSVLHNAIDGHSAQSYTSLWTHFQTTDKKPDGKVWDIYSDVPGGTPPYTYTFGSDQCGNYSGEGSCYNREHSFPASWFNDAEPAITDLYHIYPTDGYVNGRRSNYPFGEVSSPTWTSRNGSRLGPNTTAGYSGTVFEPIDEYKGDLARSYFYMATRYYGEDGSWPGSDMMNGSQPKAWAVDLLLAWNAADPVSDKEIARNNAIAAIQGNRNPFIDIPEFSGLIWGGLAWAPENAALDLSTPGKVMLTWDDISDNETGFRVAVNGCTYAETGANAESAELSGFAPGSSLRITVSSLSSGGVNTGNAIQATFPEVEPAVSRRIMAYNLHNYGEDFPSDMERNGSLRTVISETSPDVIMFCEVWGENGAFQVLRDSVFLPVSSEYSLHWVDQPAYQDIGCAFKSDVFDFISDGTVDITTDYLRDAYEIRLREKISGRDFLVYGLHLKANDYSNNDENLGIRAAQTNALRNYLTTLPDSIPRFVVGDFNMLNASEAGWTNFTGERPDDEGRLYDPVKRAGEWNENRSFADVHTHSSTWVDSRFDFVLHSAEAEDSSGVKYVPGSYTIPGNDGAHFQKSVTYMPNAAASAELAAALADASDHLPVYADYLFGPWDPDTTQTPPDSSSLIISQDFESGWQDWTTESLSSNENWALTTEFGGAESSATAAHINGFGADAASQDYLKSPVFSLENASSAEFIYSVNGRYTGNILQVQVRTGGSDWTMAAVHGASGSSTWTGWVPSILDLDPYLGENEVQVAFYYSSSGTGAGQAAAFMVDEITLRTETATGLVSPGLTELPSDLLLLSHYPNPFNSSMEIRFRIQQTADVTMTVYDISGRLAARTVSRNMSAGEHSLTWNAAPLSSGLYFVRISSGHSSSAFKALLLK